MYRDDMTRLRHMHDAAAQAIEAIEGKARADIREDRMLLLGLCKCIEIIGEAAGRVSEEFRTAHPELPWPVMVAMRNRLIHAYFDVDPDIVWNTIVGDLPKLKTTVEVLLSSGRCQ